jgi:hypothetical protein
MHKIKALLFVCFLILNSFVFAAYKDSVNLYIQIQDIWDLDYNKSTVQANFYLVMEGYKSDSSKTIYLLNGETLSCDTINNDTTRYFVIQIKALMKTEFDFSDYPLDDQKLVFRFEPYRYASEQVFYSMLEQNVFVDTMHIKGWDVGKIQFKNNKIVYHIKEKDGFHDYAYNNAFFTIPITRKNRVLNLMKSFLPSIIALIIIYIGFFIPIKKVESRFNISLGSLFVVISNFIVIQSYLPEMASLTLIEKLNLITLVIIVFTIMYFAITYYKRKSPVALRMIRITYIFVSLVLYLGMGLLFFV